MMRIAAWPGLFGDPSDWDAFLSALEERLVFQRVSGGEGCDVAAGYSMGGRRALHAASLGRVRRALVLVSSQPGIEDPVARRERQFADRALAARLRDWQGDKGAFFDWWWSQEVFASWRWSRDFARRLARRRRKTCLKSAAADLETWGPGAINLWPALEALPVPVLAVAGELDSKYAGIAREIARRAPRGSGIVIPDAGHMLHLEAPAALAAAVADFLAEIPAGSA